MNLIFNPEHVEAALAYVDATDPLAPASRCRADKLKELGRQMECDQDETRPHRAMRILAVEVLALRAVNDALTGKAKRPAGHVGCAACDRGDFHLGHHHECPVITGRSLPTTKEKGAAES